MRDPLDQGRVPDNLTAMVGSGQLGRREFIRRAVALGCSTTAIAAALAACGGSTAPATSGPSAAPTTAATSAATTAAAATPPAGTVATASAASGSTATRGAATPGAAGTATRAASPAAGGGATGGLGAPTTAALGAAGGLGPGPTKRGAAGTLKILYWQAPSTLNPHFSSGGQNSDPARLVLEPLANFDKNDRLVPWLAAEIPTQANGGLAADGKSVTWKLKQGVKWSDGTPFTAKDVVFTWRYVSTKETGATTLGNYLAIETAEVVDDYTVKATFKAPNPAWYLAFTDAILPEHIFRDAVGANAKTHPGNLKPIGTGPYVVADFKPGDSVSYTINPNWRDPNGPAFERVEWKGGGDAVSAARAVFQTGDYQFAWNLQVEPQILNQIVQAGGNRARLGLTPGAGVERIVFNFTDPNKEDPATGERSSIKFPHPFHTDKRVRQAFNLVADRKTIAEALYGQTAEPWPLIQNSPTSALPEGLTWEFNLDKAAQLLDDAGWRKNGQYRAKDGVQMKLLFQTTNNSVRQKTQQILKDALEKLGVQTELKAVESGVFFSTDAGNNDTAKKFYADWEMYGGSSGSPDGQRFLNYFTTAQIPQKANSWGLNNDSRYANPEYDRLAQQAATELDPAKRAAIMKAEYKFLYDDAAALPLVSRNQAYGYVNGLAGFEDTPWSPLTWNLANWTKQ
jgi:peptide/nickel transport system substrate-binding protein